MSNRGNHLCKDSCNLINQEKNQAPIPNMNTNSETAARLCKGVAAVIAVFLFGTHMSLAASMHDHCTREGIRSTACTNEVTPTGIPPEKCSGAMHSGDYSSNASHCSCLSIFLEHIPEVDEIRHAFQGERFVFMTPLVS